MPLFPALCALVLAAAGASPATSVQNSPAEPIYSALAGAWVGGLEYRDYSSNARVVLPTILDIQRVKGIPSLALHYIYDDGPTKVAQDTETVTVDPAAATYTVVSEDGKETTKDSLVGAGALLKTHRGTLVRFGKGTENGKAVDVRTTLTVAADRLTILKETRPLAGTFQFRDQYTLRRVESIVMGK